VGDILIDNAAKAAGQPVDAFVTQDAAKRAQPVSEAEILQFYEQNRDRAQGRTLDQLRGQIKDFLESQRKGQARAQLIAELKSKGNDVRVLLDPPRYTVAVEDHDPIRGEATAPVTLVEFSDYQ
jgi:protein-disulfide isomerase